jgi:hypothetical protein
MMNKSLRARGRESSRKTLYGFQRDDRVAETDAKKEPPFPAALKFDNREASNRVDRSHSVSKQDNASHRRESLTDGLRTILFRLHLPCRPVAERLNELQRPSPFGESSLRKQGPITTSGA